MIRRFIDWLEWKLRTRFPDDDPPPVYSQCDGCGNVTTTIDRRCSLCRAHKGVWTLTP